MSLADSDVVDHPARSSHTESKNSTLTIHPQKEAILHLVHNLPTEFDVA